MIKNSLLLRLWTFVSKMEPTTTQKIEKVQREETKKNSKRKRLLWIDDILNPNDPKMDWLAVSPIGREVNVIWVKNFFEFRDWIQRNGLPDAICFDHDLGKDSPNGYYCAKWLIRYCKDNNLSLPLWGSQSTNPEQKALINRLLKDSIKTFS